MIAAMLALAMPAMAERLDLPSEGLESRVEFWKKVFTQYGKDDLIIHDRFHVNLIYDVANGENVKSRAGAVESALDEIRRNLDAPESLSLMARQIAGAILSQGLSITPPLLDSLRNNIHTQRGIKERFRQGIIRSGRYIASFQEILRSEGVPETIALLPLVESSFENRSFSKAGAAGIWQFTRQTGRMYLRVTNRIDERLDPVKATHAAARLLNQNYRALGNWPLAITAYNHGRAGMLRARKAHDGALSTIINDYDGPLFGYASMNFYAEFIAAVQVYESYPRYFGELVLDAPAAKQSVTPAQTAKRAGAATPSGSAGDTYIGRKGDTLWHIARRFGTTIRDLMEINNLRISMIHEGQILSLTLR